MTNKNNIVIGGGPSGLFTTYLLLKSGEQNVSCYEKNTILGGDWSEDLPSYTHSTTVLMKNSKANEIFVDSFNYLNGTNLNVKDWLDLVSKKVTPSSYNEVFKNLRIRDLFKIIVWYLLNTKDKHTISLQEFSKQSRVSTNTKRILSMISNLTVDGCKGTSIGTLTDILTERMRPSTFLFDKSILSPRELIINKQNLWIQLEKSITKLGGKI